MLTQPVTDRPARQLILIEFYWSRDKDPRVPLGHASLLAALHTNAPQTRVHTIAEPINLSELCAERLATQILDIAGDQKAQREVDLAIGVYVWAETTIQALLKELTGRGFAGRIILGGPQISYAHEHLEDLYPAATHFVRGYGEDALVALASGHDAANILGVHVARSADQRKQSAVDLEQLPSPWLTNAIPLAGQRFVRWETQRGCPFRCAFCQHREAGERLRRRSLHQDRVMEEIDLFCRHEVEQIAVLDPIFNASKTATSILRRFEERGYRGHLGLQCRAESIRADFIDAATSLDVTLEFGLQTIHEHESKIIERRNDIARVDQALEMTREANIDHEVSLIFGLPMQTLESFVESVAWCLEREVPTIKAFPLMLLRGTPLERDRERWELVERAGELPVVIRSTSFDEEDWEQMAALSEALRSTEGRHPRSIEELKRLASDLHPEMARWSP
jgi:radical SAM superfamily enzyme YgiQ (UPF0313 family)